MTGDQPVRFRGRIRYWNPDKAGGLAVADVPMDQISALGGLKQQRVSATIEGMAFTSNVMPAGGGRLALSVSKAVLKSAGLDVGDEADLEIALLK